MSTLRESSTCDWAVLWDMDGVLADSEPQHRRVLLEYLAEHGCSMELKDIDRYTGRSPYEQMAELGPICGIDKEPAQMVRERMLRYREMVRAGQVHPVPGALELLQALRAAGAGLALASSNTRPNAEVIIEVFKLEGVFGAVLTAEDVARGKPAPDLYLTAAERLGVLPARCVVIEDAHAGVQAARNAAMACVGLVNPNSGTTDVSGADLVVHALAELDPTRLRGLLRG